MKVYSIYWEKKPETAEHLPKNIITYGLNKSALHEYEIVKKDIGEYYNFVWRAELSLWKYFIEVLPIFRNYKDVLKQL